ncbi:MAG: hypothetical protein D6724_11075, partial [Armatimonadetes bacterium]
MRPSHLYLQDAALNDSTQLRASNGGRGCEDRVTSITRPGMTTNTFAYNGFGARVSKTDSAGTTTYLRSGTSVV